MSRFKLVRQTEVDETRVEFEKLVVETAIALFQCQVNIIRLLFCIDTVSESLREVWNTLEAEVKKNSTTFFAK